MHTHLLDMGKNYFSDRHVIIDFSESHLNYCPHMWASERVV